MKSDELQNRIKRSAAVWWASHAPIGEMSQHDFCEAVVFIVNQSVVAATCARISKLTEACEAAAEYHESTGRFPALAKKLRKALS